MSKQLKALFLLLIFSFNILVGFACSVGTDVSNDVVQGDKKFAEINDDAHLPEKHEHSEHHETNSTPALVHHQQTHKHSAVPTKTETAPSGKHDEKSCCTDDVYKIFKTDKSLPKSTKVLGPGYYSIINRWFNIEIQSFASQTRFTKYYVRGHHPPIPDIRVAIRSFQI